MGNLTNPVSLRLRLNVYWNSLWVSYIDNNYSFLLSSDFLLYSYIRWFTYRKIFLTVGWLFYYSHFKIFRLFDKIFIIFFFKDYKFYKFFFEYVCIILKLNNSLHKKNSLGIFKNIKLLNNFNVSKFVSTTNKMERKKKNYLNFCWLFIFFDLQKVFYTLSFNNKTKTMDKIYIFFKNIFFLTNFIYLFFVFLFVVFFFFNNFNKLQFNLKKKLFNNLYLYIFASVFFLNTARTYSNNIYMYSVANPISFFTTLNLNYRYFTNKNIMFNIKKRKFLIKVVNKKPRIFLRTANPVFFNHGLLPFKKIIIKKLSVVNFIKFDRLAIYKLNFLKKTPKANIKNLLNTNFFFKFVNTGLIYFKTLYNFVFVDINKIQFNRFISAVFKKVWVLRRNRKRMRAYKYIIWLRRIVKRAVKLLNRKTKFNNTRFYLSFFSFSAKWIFYIHTQFSFFKGIIQKNQLQNQNNFFYNNIQINRLFQLTNNNTSKFVGCFAFKYFIWKLYYYYYFKQLIYFKSFCKYKNYFSKFFRNLIFVKTRKIVVKKNRYLKKFNNLNKKKLKKFIRFFNKKYSFVKNQFITNKQNNLLFKKPIETKTFFYTFNDLKVKRNKKNIKIFFSFPNLLVHRRLVFSYFNKRFKKYLLAWRLGRFNTYGYIYNNVYSYLSFNNILLKYTWNRTIKFTNIKFKHGLKKDLSLFFNQYIKLNSITVKNPCVLNSNILKFYLNILNNFLIILLFRKLKNIGLFIKYYLHLFLFESKKLCNNVDIDLFKLKNFSSFFYYLNLFLKYLNLVPSYYNNSFLTHYFIILKKSVHSLFANIFNKKNLILNFKYFYSKLFEFISFFFSSIKEISKYRLFFIQSISLLSYISKNFNISNLNFKISLKKKSNILFLKKKNKMNFFIKKRFSKFFYCENFLDLNKNLLLFKYKLLSFSSFRLVKKITQFNSYFKQKKFLSLWFVNTIRFYKFLPKLIFIKKDINVSKSLFNNFMFITNFFNLYFFKKFANNIRFFYKKLFFSFNINYFYFLKINNFWNLIPQIVKYDINASVFSLGSNINITLFSIFSYVYNKKYLSLNNSLKKGSLYYNFSYTFIKNVNDSFLQRKVGFEIYLFIYRYFSEHLVDLFDLKKMNRFTTYFSKLKNCILFVYLQLFSLKFVKIKLFIFFLTKFLFKKLFLVSQYKVYFYKIIFYSIFRYWFFKFIFSISEYVLNINLFSTLYWKIFFYKHFSIKNKDLAAVKYWKYSLYLYNTFKFSVILRNKKKIQTSRIFNFWLFNKQINLSIFFYKNNKKKLIGLTKKNYLLHYIIFKKNLKIKKVKYIKFLQTLKQTQKSKLYIHILKNLLKTII